MPIVTEDFDPGDESDREDDEFHPEGPGIHDRHLTDEEQLCPDCGAASHAEVDFCTACGHFFIDESLAINGGFSGKLSGTFTGKRIGSQRLLWIWTASILLAIVFVFLILILVDIGVIR